MFLFSPCSHLVRTGNCKLFLVFCFSLPPTMTLFTSFLSVSIIIVSWFLPMMFRPIILCQGRINHVANVSVETGLLSKYELAVEKWWPLGKKGDKILKNSVND